MSDRLAIPAFSAVARGSYPAEFKGESRTTKDGRALHTVLIVCQVPSPWRPIPEAVEVEVSVPAPLPKIEEGTPVTLHGVVLRAAKRQSGAPYLAVSADRVELERAA